MAEEGVISFSLDDQNTLRIRIGDSNTGRFVLATAIEIERFITQLASFRKDMRPEVPRILDTFPSGEVDPIWHIAKSF